MDTVSALFTVLGAGLQLWEHKEKTKYQDKFISLKRDYYEEFNKPFNDRSDAVLDNILFELLLLASSFGAVAGKPDVKS